MKARFERRCCDWRELLFAGLLLMPVGASRVEAQTAAGANGRRVEWALIVHGGALDEVDKIPVARKAAMEAGLKQAVDAGKKVLADGGTALDAVETCVRILEDNPLFNAGKGAVYNAVGRHELDASIMDGSNRACGAVAGVTTVKNPISLARLVMTRTRHVLLIADGAEKFADEMKIERVDNKWFDTDEQYERWQARKAAEAKRAAEAQPASKPMPMPKALQDKKGTVGCVALDKHGNLAAGTSTGGLTNKKYGRVGDSPIIGAGTYADNATCAVSCTGTG
ncbi:MAG TPA: isoaspartyl peptidase/L-asparaginase, partial [Pirellulaceae bacterium]|nr:isoaspartyl peptidase/L-asparaginase [Pirellulaceae bacterium]